MTRQTVDHILDYLSLSGATTLDITGGAPELIRNFKYLVEQTRQLDIHVIDRCNLTILNERGQEDLAAFLADQQVEIIASMPCYSQDNVDGQRGDGVFESSISALRKLNTLGYGKAGSELVLNLIYNPTGPYLPPPQQTLEKDYKRELGKYGVEFNQLFTLTNMPIQRFGSTLISKGEFETYMKLLKSAYQEANLGNVMCRNLISIDWQGYVYDCDFNQMLGLSLSTKGTPKPHIRDLMQVDITGNPIAVADHCYGCTAGQGSSCGGALA